RHRSTRAAALRRRQSRHHRERHRGGAGHVRTSPQPRRSAPRARRVSSTSAMQRMSVDTLVRPFVVIGNMAIRGLTELRVVAQFFATLVALALRPPYRFTLILQQAEFVGVGSLFIIVLTGTFTGAVFTLQTVNGLAQFNLESVVGTTVMIGVTRELAPVLTA